MPSRVAILLFSVLLAGLGIVLAGCGGQKSQETSTPAATSPKPPEQEKKEAKQTYTVQDVSGGAVVKGRVTFIGAPVPAKKTVVNQDREVCGKEQIGYPVRVEKGGIVDAVVWIEDLDHGKAFDFPPPVLDQKGCVYVPHITLMQPGELKVETKEGEGSEFSIVLPFNSF